MATVRLVGVTKRFGDVVAVRNAGFEIKDGEFMVFLGPSGGGKTTTMRCVAGLESHDQGDIFIGETLVNDLGPADRDTAFVFQNYALYPHMTVYDNLAFPLRTRKVPKATVDQRVKRVATTLALEHVLAKKPNKLSGGEMQRVAIGRAMVREPKVFLLDEPLSNLDAKQRERMRVELKRLQTDLKATMIYVTHDQTDAMAMADRIVIINHGSIQQIGTPLEVYDRPANLFVARFVGSPTINLADCSLMEEGGVVKLQEKSNGFSLAIDREMVARIRDRATGEDLVAGFRPEDIHVRQVPVEEGIEGEVYTVEPQGPVNLVDLKFGGNVWRARTPRSMEVSVGDKVWVTFEFARLQVFDKKTEKSLVQDWVGVQQSE